MFGHKLLRDLEDKTQGYLEAVEKRYKKRY